MKNINLTLDIPIMNLEYDWKGKWKDLPRNKTYQLFIDYPFSATRIFNIKTGKIGVTFFRLLKIIGQKYETMYADVEKGYLGTFHSIEDLHLEGIIVDHKKRIIKLEIGS